MSGISIGQHDTGLFDWADKIQTGAKIASGMSAEEALDVAQKHGGAELLVQTEGEDETARYDVYELSVGDGKSLTSVDLFDHVSFDQDLPEKLGGKSVSIVAETEKDGYTYVGHIQSHGRYNGVMHMNERIRTNMSYDD